LRNQTVFKIGHLAQAISHAKAVAFAKWSVSVKNQKCQEHTKNNSTGRLQLFCAKSRLEKYQISKK